MTANFHTEISDRKQVMYDKLYPAFKEWQGILEKYGLPKSFQPAVTAEWLNEGDAEFIVNNLVNEHFKNETEEISYWDNALEENER